MRKTVKLEFGGKQYAVSVKTKDPEAETVTDVKPLSLSITERSGIKQIKRWNKELDRQSKIARRIVHTVKRFKLNQPV